MLLKKVSRKRSWYSRKAVLWLWNKNMFKPKMPCYRYIPKHGIVGTDLYLLLKSIYWWRIYFSVRHIQHIQTNIYFTNKQPVWNNLWSEILSRSICCGLSLVRSKSEWWSSIVIAELNATSLYIEAPCSEILCSMNHAIRLFSQSHCTALMAGL